MVKGRRDAKIKVYGVADAVLALALGHPSYVPNVTAACSSRCFRTVPRRWRHGMRTLSSCRACTRVTTVSCNSAERLKVDDSRAGV